MNNLLSDDITRVKRRSIATGFVAGAAVIAALNCALPASAHGVSGPGMFAMPGARHNMTAPGGGNGGGYGFGCGTGCGSGPGYGSGYGSGRGPGTGPGAGYGSGYGPGSNFGSGNGAGRGRQHEFSGWDRDDVAWMHSHSLTAPLSLSIAVPALVPAVVPAPAYIQAPPPAPPPPPAPVTKVMRLSADALFPFDRGNIEDVLPGGRAQLRDIAAQLRTMSFGRIEVRGYTDRIGTASYNLGLSQCRASAIKSLLIEEGIPADRIDARGLGKQESITQCPESLTRDRLIACLQPDRRVEIVTFAQTAAMPPAPPPAANAMYGR